MKQVRKFLAWALCLCLLLGTAPGVLAADSAETCTVSLTGNTGAWVDCGFTPLSAEVDNNELAIVELRGQQVRVLAKDGAVGLVRLTIEGSEGFQFFDIPLGYTTFVFQGEKLTVIPGSDANYEISGINAAGEEYLADDPSYPLPVGADALGRAVYENSEAYKLCVNIKKAGGTYVFTGTGSDGSIAVKKAATAPAVLLLAGLDLSSSFTAPLTVKKESTSTATVTALGGFENRLADAAFNNADLYGDPTENEGADGSNAACAESAVIKAKSSAQLTLNGAGSLELVCASKNALKVGVSGSLCIDALRLKISSVKNGISSDNTMTINGGVLEISSADGDCIRSDPDAVDAAAGCAGCITINGGHFTLQAGSDGIQAAQDLTINGGEFHITTGSGWNDSSFNKDTMSCKGLKASSGSEDESAEATNRITINGGSFELNTADDAIHSDADISINGGLFAIQTGDDGVHGDGEVVFGAANASDCAVQLSVSKSYEGLEGSSVTVNSGCYNVIASDDGINSAGGSSSGSDPGGPGGGWGGWVPGGGSSSATYHITVNGGLVNVNADGDGLDANGNLTLSGGSVVVWGQARGGDNSPLDADGTILIQGGTVFAAGSNPMNERPSTSSQTYITYGGSSGGGPGGPGGGYSGSTITSGRTVVVKNASSQVVFSIQAPKDLNYVLYSSPSTTSSWSISADSSSPTVSTLWSEHSFGSYSQTSAPSCTVAGLASAVCSACGETRSQAIAPRGHSFALTQTVAPTASEEGYDVYTCSACGGTYRTNFTEPTGEIDPCLDGHSWDEGVVTVQPSCTEAGVTTYTCTVCGERSTVAAPSALGHSFSEAGVCTRCGVQAYRASFVCTEGVSVTVYPSQDLSSGGVVDPESVLVRSSGGSIDVSGSGQLNFTVSLAEGYAVERVEVSPAGSYNAIKYPTELGIENAYRITKISADVTVTVYASTDVCPHSFDEDGICTLCGTVAPRALFALDGHSSVTAYPTQDLSAGGQAGVTVALARNSDTGEIDLNGGGQVNFTVQVEEGYELADVSAEGSYKNLKGPADTGVENGYRLTKVSGDVTVTVSTRPVGGSLPEEPITISDLDIRENISLGAELVVNYRLVNDAAFKAYGFDSFWLEFIRHNLDGTTTTTLYGEGKDQALSANGSRSFDLKNTSIPAAEMGVEYELIFHGLVGDQEYVTAPRTGSLRDYFASQLEGIDPSASNGEARLRLAADTLLYGARSQAVYNADQGELLTGLSDLAQERLEAYGSFGVPAAEDQIRYSADGLVNPTIRLSLQDRLEITVRWVNANAETPVVVEFWPEGNEAAKATVPATLKTSTWTAVIDSIGAAGVRELYRFRVLANGVPVTNEALWSVESYIAANREAASQPLQALYNAILNYGDSVVNYFG